MAITKMRTAVNREYACADCNCIIKKGDKYYDSKEPANPPKPFPVRKYCLSCGEKKSAKQG